MMVFADKRYNRADKRNKLPGWITSCLKDAHLNLSTDMVLHITREFMRQMAQPNNAGTSSSLLDQVRGQCVPSPSPQRSLDVPETCPERALNVP
jgi:DNA excision repair protein ERCC-2